MATLTIADLDNGKRDLETVDAVANSQTDTTPTRYGQQTLTLSGALRRLGWQAPVPYASGLTVDHATMTVERDGVVYRPDPALVPFTTGAWNPDQWRVLQNTHDTNQVYQFSTLGEAQSAAATLPEGSAVIVEGESQGSVVTGAYTPDSGTPAVRLQSYVSLGNYSGKSEAVDITTPGISGRFYRRGNKDENGGTVIKDALGRSWERDYSGYLNVQWFGADRSGVADSTTAIQKAIDAAFVVNRVQTPGGNTVFAPEGSYKISSILLKRGVSLLGAGQRATRLYSETAATMIALDDPMNAAGDQAGMTIEKLMIDGGGVNPLAGGSRIATIGINVEGMHHGAVRDCLIQRCKTAGLYSRQMVVDFNIERSFIIANALGFDHRGGWATTIRYINCEVVFNDTGGGILEGIPVATLLNTIVEKNYGYGLQIRGVNSIVSVIDSYFEDNKNVQLYINGGPVVDVSKTYFTVTANKGAGQSLIYVGLETGKVLLTDNTFNGNATGNTGSADIASAPDGAKDTIYVADNLHIGGFATYSGGANKRIFGKPHNATALESRHSLHRWTRPEGSTSMQLNQTGLFLNGGGWNTEHLQLGGTHIWVDSNAKLRIKFGAPTSDTDGAVVGTQT